MSSHFMRSHSRFTLRDAARTPLLRANGQKVGTQNITQKKEN